MSPSDAFALAMLAVTGLVVVGGVTMAVLVRRLSRRERVKNEAALKLSESQADENVASFLPAQTRRPASWMAIRTRDMVAVQIALGLRDAAPCSWAEGLVSSRKLFIAPPVNGWTLVFGSGLPDPGDDVDAAFRLLRELSRKLGHVQFFQAEPLLQHHAWVLAEFGRVVRAYAWAGATVWNQGVKTAAETTLGVKCFGYGETLTTDEWTVAEFIVTNVEKVPQIARRWSLDPAEIDLRTLANAQGIAGQHLRRY
jgi:hypothetical protein